MRKQIKDYENYYISDDGTLYNEKTKKFLTGRLSQHGYYHVGLSKDNKKKEFYIHRLVAEYFIPNPNNYPIVNHIDGNKTNNNASNLEWVTYTENNNHAFKEGLNRKKENMSLLKYEYDLEEEEWLPIPGYENYLVSNCGRVRNLKKNNLLRGSEVCGYLKVALCKNGKAKDFTIHSLVFYTFHKELNEDTKNYIIDHIDGNKKNNNLSNLRCISQKDNVLASYYGQNTNKNIKPVIQYDLDGNILNEFPSASECARQLHLYSTSISACCRGKLKTTGGYIFKYK